MNFGSLNLLNPRWIENIDPGGHRRIKGLRLITAYAAAAMLGNLVAQTHHLENAALLPSLAGNFALWASVSEGEADPERSSRDMLALILAAGVGALCLVSGRDQLRAMAGTSGPELMLVGGAFLVGYLRRFGLLGAGIGSQIYIGLLLSHSYGLTFSEVTLILLAALIAAPCALVPRLLSAPVEHPAPFIPISRNNRWMPTELAMALQAALPALIIVALNGFIGLTESAWAITASTYVVAESTEATLLRIRHRIVGTLVGVALGLAIVPLIDHWSILVWSISALTLMIYAVALPRRYEVACGAFAFILMITLALAGDRSIEMLASRAWETVLGCSLGFVAAKWLSATNGDPASNGAASSEIICVDDCPHHSNG